MLRLLRQPVRREPLFRRGCRYRRAQGQRPFAPSAELGAVPGLGKRPLHGSLAALFLGEPVLGASHTVIPGWSEGTDPESRDSGFDASHRPGMTIILPVPGDLSYTHLRAHETGRN